MRAGSTAKEPSPVRAEVAGSGVAGAGSGLQRIQEMPEIQEISQFLRKAQILKNSLGSRETGLDSALGAARCHPLPSLF